MPRNHNADLELPCPTCKAKMGADCFKTIARSGRRIPLAEVHAARRSPPWQAYRFAYPLIMRKRGRDHERIHPMGKAEVANLGDLALDLVPDPDTLVCRNCGCYEQNPCEGGCWWVTEDFCSACTDPTDEVA
jgi:hypothetical protein